MLDTSDDPIYPIGKMILPDAFSKKEFLEAIEELKVLPRILDYCIENLDAHQLTASYRADGWTINQIIHHIADSHINAFVRIKLMLTENNPSIKPYKQDDWVLSADVQDVPVNYSITLVHALHHRLAVLLASLSEEQLQRTYYHPEYQKTVSLWQVAHTYAWHGRHHAEQIRQLRIHNGW